MPKMNQEILSRFLADCERVFSFLTTEYSFPPPVREVDSSIAFANVAFVGTHVAIEFILDDRDQDISCMISIVNNGSRTKAFERDETGKKVREYLSAWLLARGVRSRLFTPTTQMAFGEQIPVVLADFARMLREHGAEVLNDRPLEL